MDPNNKVQLITYPDSLGGNLVALDTVLNGSFAGLFQAGVHILPLYPSSGDRGFAPLTYFEIEPQFGDWSDVKQISESHPVVVDIMVNHISRQSSYFQDFVEKGRASEYADLFITLEKVWADGNPPAADVAQIFLRKPEHPFSDIEIKATGEVERIWTSFGPRVDWSEQIDLDVHSAQTRQLFNEWFAHMAANGISIIRLDAVGYCIKKAGTSCFFVEPDIYQFMTYISEMAAGHGLLLMPEVHAHYEIQAKLADAGYWVYDFVLPGLVLHTLLTGSAEKLTHYLNTCPRTQFTTLDTHDGIPIQPDLDDILSIEESLHVVAVCEKRGANINRILGEDHLKHAGFDAHQINITYYDALDRNDDAYIAARAIQFFAPGVPQIYYVGMLAGENDLEALAEQEDGRAINRTNYTIDEVAQAMQKPVVQRLKKLIDYRNTHPAFDGELTVQVSTENHLILTRKTINDCTELTLNLSNFVAIISDETGRFTI